MLDFDMFLHSFEQTLIETLVRRNKHELETGRKSLISE